MRIIKKIKSKKILKFFLFFKKLPLLLAKKAFLFSLILFLVALVLGGFVFFKYYLSVKKDELINYKKEIEFKEKEFNNILNIWQEREKKFQEADSKNYLNPF